MSGPDPDRRLALQALAMLPLGAALGACGGGSGASLQPVPAPATRSWQLGFSPNPPVPTVAAVLAGIDLWSRRAELAIIHEELPWTDLLTGMSPGAILDRDKVALVNYLRGKGLELVFMGDLTDGLAREMEAPQLRALGRSITEPVVQALYRDYMLAVSSKLTPRYLGLAAETNLIRVAAGPAVYAAVVQSANAAAAALKAAGSPATLFTSVQVETAWGGIAPGGTFAGIAQDLLDFAFSELLGFSSYPYFRYAQPEDIPPDYYSRLAAGQSRPIYVVEGGWTSASVGTIASSPEAQARYIARHAQLLDGVGARGLLQLEFADIDLTAVPPPVPANLPLFTQIGLTRSDFSAKPALAAWDQLFQRPFRAP